MCVSRLRVKVYPLQESCKETLRRDRRGGKERETETSSDMDGLSAGAVVEQSARRDVWARARLQIAVTHLFDLWVAGPTPAPNLSCGGAARHGRIDAAISA